MNFLMGFRIVLIPVDAVLTFDGKWLLNSDNYIYMANLSVAIDLHSGFYLKDPSLNGKKVKTLLPYYKGEDNYLIVGIDENNTYFGIVMMENVFIIQPLCDRSLE